jgi:ribonuclease-3
MLAHRIDVLGFQDALLMGKGDVEQNAQNDASVKEDLFEAILGAVAIDCDWNTRILEDVVDKMIDIEHYINNGLEDEQNYVDLIQQWCQKKYLDLPYYEFEEYSDGFKCFLWLSCEWKPFVGNGYSKQEARMNAAESAYQYLEEENELILPIDEVGEPDIDRAINQLQELYQKGYIGQPWYDFLETYDPNGNPVWRCECHIEGKDEYWWRNHSSKRYGKKAVAYDMLCEVLGLEEDDET